MNEQSLKPVVVGIDGSPTSLDTVRFAAAEAAVRGLPLRVVNARSWPSYTGDVGAGFTYSIPPPPNPHSRHVVDEAVAMARKEQPDLAVSGHVIDGGATIVLVGESEHAELVVVGSRGEGGLAELVLGSVALDVATRAKSPVLVFRGEGNPYGPVVVGVDGRRTCWDAIRFAFTEAAARDVPLHAVHVWHLSNAEAVVGGSDKAGRDSAERLLGAWLNDWEEEFPSVRVVHSPQHTVDVTGALTDASASASLLVLGSRMRGELRSRLLGSTGYAMIHASRCPVAIVHNTKPAE